MTAAIVHFKNMAAADWAVVATAATVLGLAVRDVRRQMREGVKR